LALINYKTNLTQYLSDDNTETVNGY